MTSVRMLPSEVTVEIAPGERLLDACDFGPPGTLPVACRAGTCGSCQLQVLHGAEAFLPASVRERSTLQQLGAAAGERLGCQLICASELPGDPIVLRLHQPPDR
jgi:ferredoxin